MINAFRANTVVFAITLALGCATTDPYTGESGYDPNATAALVGGLAVAGAVAYSTPSNKANSTPWPTAPPSPTCARDSRCTGSGSRKATTT